MLLLIKPKDILALHIVTAMIGNYSSSDLTFLKPGALVKFVPPVGHYFLPNGTITSTRGENTRTYFWSQIVNVIEDGQKVNPVTATSPTA